ncbi:hypothetical protein Tco_0808143 [Tanacetum coccineum]
MTRKYFLAYTQTEVQQFHDTLIQHMESIKKSIDERALHKREYNSRVNERQMQKKEGNIDTAKALDASLVITESSGTEFEKQNTSNSSGNDADDAYIKPVYEEEPMAEENMNSNSNGISSTGVEITTKTRRPQPRSNTKNDMVSFMSKSSCIKNKEVENDKSEVVCAMCKQCLITTDHDVCVLNYVNGMNSFGDKLSANISKVANQKKHKPEVKKPKKVRSKERLVSPKPSKPRIYLRWSPNRRIFNLKGKIIASSEFERQSNSSNGDLACNSNPQEPTIKQFLDSTSFLGRLSRFIYGALTQVVPSI